MKHTKKINESSEFFKKELLDKISKGVPNWQISNILRDKIDYVRDGVWDISNIDFIELSPNTRNDKKIENHINKLSEFLDKYPDCVIADAYQTENPFLLSSKPKNRVDYMGNGFNYGSNNIIDNCPKRILICAEDD